MPEEDNINFYRNPPKNYQGSIIEWKEELIKIIYEKIFKITDGYINTGYEGVTIRMHPKDVLWIKFQDMDQKKPASPVKANLIVDRKCDVGTILVEVYIHHALSFEEFTKVNVDMFVKSLLKDHRSAIVSFSITLIDEEGECCIDE